MPTQAAKPPPRSHSHSMTLRTGRSTRRGRRLAFIAAWVLSSSSPLLGQRTAAFEHGIVAHGDWLQANALPLDRDAFQSSAAELSFRGRGWVADGGWLRVARSLSTVQGPTLSLGRLLPWKGMLFMPAVGGFLGRAQRSVDSTGFDFVDPQTGAVGHTPRYSYSSATSVGGGAGLTIEIPFYRAIALRGVAWQWWFSGDPLEGDRARTVIGAGLSVRLPGGR
jgi:hypothetical protein